ncbi:MAG: hypothetical protein ACK6CU_04985, partial [Deltaproteobacteria bacterium]
LDPTPTPPAAKPGLFPTSGRPERQSLRRALAGPALPLRPRSAAVVVEVIDLATSANTLLVEEGRPATVAAAHRCILGAFDAAEDIDEVSVVLEPYQYLWAADPLRHGAAR